MQDTHGPENTCYALDFRRIIFFPALIGPDVAVNTSGKHIFSLFCVRWEEAVNFGKVPTDVSQAAEGTRKVDTGSSQNEL